MRKHPRDTLQIFNIHFQDFKPQIYQGAPWKDIAFIYKLFDPPQTSNKHADISNLIVGTHPFLLSPSDSLLESLTIPTPNQMISQSQTLEPTPDETAPESPNQESTATETHDIAHHTASYIPNQESTATDTHDITHHSIDETFESQSQLKVSTPKKRSRSSKKLSPDKRKKN